MPRGRPKKPPTSRLTDDEAVKLAGNMIRHALLKRMIDEHDNPPKKRGRGRPMDRWRDLKAHVFMVAYSKATGITRGYTLAKVAIRAGMVELPANPGARELDTVLQRLDKGWRAWHRIKL